MKTKVFKNESRVAFLNSYTFKKPLPKLVFIGWLKQIQGSQMVIENGNKSIYNNQNP
jgi:hypothetical protein